MANEKTGVVYVWGKGKDCLGLPPEKIDREGICALPALLPLKNIIQVDCGENCTAAVDRDGKLFVWGSEKHSRLARDSKDHSPFQPIPSLLSIKIREVAVGESHLACRSAEGHVYCWGQNAHGALGNGQEGYKGSTMTPSLVCDQSGKELQNICKIACGYLNTAAVSSEGSLYLWGLNEYSKCGIPERKSILFPQRISFSPPPRFPKDSIPKITTVSLGSTYSGATTSDGDLYLWGYGGAGNLGFGDRLDQTSPVWVPVWVQTREGNEGKEKKEEEESQEGKKTTEKEEESEERAPEKERLEFVTSVACATGQIALPNRFQGQSSVPLIEGSEGPHSIILCQSGRVYSMGTSHKGILGNLTNKALKPVGCDELSPYLIGSVFRDSFSSTGPSSLSIPSPYLRDQIVISAISAHIHSAVLTETGKVFSFGCGSDGRMGVEKYLTGLHGARSRMKCYISQPTEVPFEIPRELVAKFSKDVQIRAHVLEIRSSRRHCCALVCFKKSLKK